MRCITALAAAFLVASCLAQVVAAQGTSFWASETVAKSDSAKHGALLDSTVSSSPATLRLPGWGCSSCSQGGARGVAFAGSWSAAAAAAPAPNRHFWSLPSQPVTTPCLPSPQAAAAEQQLSSLYESWKSAYGGGNPGANRIAAFLASLRKVADHNASQARGRRGPSPRSGPRSTSSPTSPRPSFRPGSS